MARGLSYCNQCGAKLSEAKGERPSKSTELSPQSLVSAIAVVFIFGIVSITAFVTMMKKIGFNEGLISAFMGMCFVLMLVLEGTFVWLLLSRRDGRKKADAPEPLKEQTTKELDATQVRILPEPAASITDHTTRTLEPVYSERKQNKH